MAAVPRAAQLESVRHRGGTKPEIDPMEPFKLRRWKLPNTSYAGEFFTCARPGRSKGADDRVPDPIVDKWVRGLPGDAKTTIVSLLGRKHGESGESEFSFYSFYGRSDTPRERHGRPSFQEWLNMRHAARLIQLLEFPTYDFTPVAPDTKVDVAAAIISQLSSGRTVVLVDSGGETRTRQVCKAMGAIEDSATAKRKFGLRGA